MHHGLGDTLQFARFVPMIGKRARSVTLLVQPALLPLFAGSADFGDVRNGWTAEPPPRHDVEIEIMELAYAFRSSVETLPRSVPYLPLAGIAARALPLSGSSAVYALRVGVLWAASGWDSSRSIALDALTPLAPLTHAEGIEFYSLQQGDGQHAWRDAPFAMHPLFEHTGDIVRAASAMLQLDLIIAVDGMPAHLAGALGRPVWVLLKHDADWRWIRERSDTPWYPTMRLFRQPRAGDWGAVGLSVAQALGEIAKLRCGSLLDRGRSAPSPQPSPGGRGSQKN